MALHASAVTWVTALGTIDGYFRKCVKSRRDEVPFVFRRLLTMKEVEGIWESWTCGASNVTHFQWDFSLDEGI